MARWQSMDVDAPLNQGSTLKRSSSAPMINLALHDSSSNGDELIPLQLFGNQPRARRFSASFSPNSHSPQSPVMPFRINQIKHEEGMDVANREVAHEREVQSALQMSLSCEDLTLTESYLPSETKRNVMEPLHIFAPPVPACSSLSPTRGRKQCYSPSMQHSVRSPNPSPTRKTYFRRSLSPIAIRPSHFPVKRKCELDERESNYYSPMKRFQSGPLTPERNMVTHPLSHSLSSSSLDDSTSPDQMVPHSGTAGTPESVSSSDSMCSSVFKPVDQDTPMQDSAPPTPETGT